MQYAGDLLCIPCMIELFVAGHVEKFASCQTSGHPQTHTHTHTHTCGYTSPTKAYSYVDLTQRCQRLHHPFLFHMTVLGLELEQTAV
jgi:hypothetical protein